MDRRISDREVYPALWIVLAVGGVIFGGWYFLLGQPPLAPCVFFSRWHIYCPACGGTRAVLALLKGDLLQSLYYNPSVLYSAFSLAAYLLSQTVWRLRGRRGWALHWSEKWLWVLAALLLGQCLLRNLLWFGFEIPL